MLNQQSEQKFFESMDAAEASAAKAFIGEDAWDEAEFEEAMWEKYQAEEAIACYHPGSNVAGMCFGCDAGLDYRKEE